MKAGAALPGTAEKGNTNRKPCRGPNDRARADFLHAVIGRAPEQDMDPSNRLWIGRPVGVQDGRAASVRTALLHRGSCEIGKPGDLAARSRFAGLRKSAANHSCAQPA